MLLIALATVRKMVFVWGESAPIWRRYRGLKFGFLVYFGLRLLGTLSTDFRFFDCVRQPHVPSNDAEHLTKIKFDNFEQCALEVGIIAVSTWNIFALPEALTMV